MGEVINFDFKNKKIIEKQNLQPEINVVTEKGTKEQYVRFAKFLISDKAKKIMNLPVTRTSYAEIEKTIEGYSIQEMVGWLENSREEDWQKKPSFFRAIIERMKILARNPKNWEGMGQ